MNMVVSASLQDEMYHDMGDYFNYCVYTGTPKVFGDLKYKPDTCQVKIKSRAIASVNRLPGFPKISSYKQINPFGTNFFLSTGQMQAIIKRLRETSD